MLFTYPACGSMSSGKNKNLKNEKEAQLSELAYLVFSKSLLSLKTLRLVSTSGAYFTLHRTSRSGISNNSKTFRVLRLLIAEAQAGPPPLNGRSPSPPSA